MKRKMKIFINIIIMAILIMAIFFNAYSYATTAAPNPSEFEGDASTDTSGISTIGNQVITIVSTLGSIASVIVLVVLGLKYMMGSAEEKAEYKKTLMPYVIGAGLVFAASAIAGIIFGFTQNLG